MRKESQKDTEREQNVTPKCATLSCGLFWAKGNQDPAESRKFHFSLICLKKCGYGAWPRKRAITRENFIWKTHLQGRANNGSPNICSSYLPVNCAPPLWSTRPLFHSLLRMADKPQLPDCLWFWHFYGASLHTKLNLFFSCYLSYVNCQFTDQPKNLEGKKKIIFSPYIIKHQNAKISDKNFKPAIIKTLQ